MYNHFRLAIKYIKYKFTAKKLHGIHSPFVYSFSEEVLYKPIDKEKFAPIELTRTQFLQNNELIEIIDLGAGSKKTKSNIRPIKQIAKHSLKPKKWAELLYKLHHYFNVKTSIELGTSLGITSAYIALANQNIKLYTIEGSPNISNIAKKNFAALSIHNIQSIVGNFDNELPILLQSLPTVDSVYIDGNHRYEPTLRYFSIILPYLHENSFVIFDDIHWSKEMEQAWKEIISHEKITISIDLFFIGIVFFRKQNKNKEHFVLTY